MFTDPNGASGNCGDLSAMSIDVNPLDNYTSRLTVTASPGLDGTMINCTLNLILEGSDTIRVGGLHGCYQVPAFVQPHFQFNSLIVVKI